MKPADRSLVIFPIVSIAFIAAIFMIPFDSNFFMNPHAIRPVCIQYTHYICMVVVGYYMFFSKKIEHKTGGEIIGSLMLVILSPIVIVTFAIVWITLQAFPYIPEVAST